MRFGSRLIALFLALLCALGAADRSYAQGSGPLYTIRQRFGVNVSPAFFGVPGFPGSLSDYAGADQLGFGWYSDWTATRFPETPVGIEFAQLVGVRSWPPNWGRLEETARSNPGSLWMIGNEPETRGQGQLVPSAYATRYHEAFRFLKGIDPTAQIGIGGLVMPTPLRLKWLELCMEFYERTYGERMPVDVWNIHVQILQERRGDWGCGIPYGLTEDEGRLYEIVDNCSVDIFKQLVLEFRIWLHELGEGDKEVIISEYGVLMPSSYLPGGDQSVLDFMGGTFDYLLTARDPLLGCPADEGRLVQRWLWFSLNFPFYERTPGGFNGALYDWQNPDQLTLFGEFYRDYAQSVRMEHVSIPASVDTYVDAWEPDTSFGHKGRTKIRADASGEVTYALLEFDLSQIPRDARVFTARLSMQAVARTNQQGVSMYVGPASGEWHWKMTYQDVQSLGLRRGEPSVLVTAARSDELIQCDVEDIVQAWCDGSRVNHGFVIDTAGAGNRGNVTYSFAASEWVEGSQQKPELAIRYITRSR